MAGRRIDDHSSWVGKSSKGVPLPSGAKMKEERSADGAGAIGDYSDTTEAIYRDQKSGDGKLRSKPLKPGYRY